MQNGVEHFFLPNIDKDSIQSMLDVCAIWKSCRPMFGLHPCSVKEDYEEQLSVIHKVLTDHRQEAIAIGEVGLDFYWDVTYKKEQETAFRIQAQWALEMDLPLVIHSRNSTDELIDIISGMNEPRLKGVFHCFSGNLEQANKIVALGFYLGIGGVVTFKNSGLDKIIPDLPFDKLLLETDGPYLAPVPFRGKRNEPAYLRLVAEKIAEIKKISLDEVAAITSSNAKKLFQF